MSAVLVRILPHLVKLVMLAVVGLGAFYGGYLYGKSQTVVEVQTVVVERQNEVNEIRERINAEAPPIGADRAANLKWLREHAVR